MSDEADRRHMAHALRMAERGNGTTWPNPSVGCVIVKDGVILGRGTTQPGGRPHAERVALAQAGAAARGATAYVTLEPCSHHGRSSPCADALIAAGIARVVSAQTDPDPRVSGRGHANLRAAGIEVVEDVLREEARAVTAGFLKRVTRGLPMVTLKLATTLDGRIATASGESRWITGPEARRAVHALRLSHDAVMVGSGTALADDPELGVRDMGAVRQPVRVLLDRRLAHVPQSRLGAVAARDPVWLLHGPEAPEEKRAAWAATGAQLIEVASTAEGLGLTAAMRALADQGLTRVFCEGGGTLAAGMIRAGLIDRMISHGAGALIGADGRAALASLGINALADAPRLHLQGLRRLGNDVEARWSFAPQ